MNGKNKCKILKDIRREIAKQNDIDLVIEECKFKGDCPGTCPRCESEVRYLERALERRRKLGKTVAVAGLVATLAVASVGCNDSDEKTDKPPQDVAGSFAPPDIVSVELNKKPEMYEISSPSLLEMLYMNEDKRSSYLSVYERDAIRTEWCGRLVYNDTDTDRFKLPLYQKTYYVTITYNVDGYAVSATIEPINTETSTTAN